MTFFEELKRRKVFRVTSLYAVTAWGASLGVAELFPTFGLPESSVRWFVIGALGLLPIVALLAWLYELTPSGIERDPADTVIDRGESDATTHIAPQKASGELTATWTGGSQNFRRSFTIGRDASCELHIDDPKISRRHARVIAQRGTWYVEDLGSSNGTSLNGELVKRAALPNRAVVTLYEGGGEITLQVDSSSGETTVFAS